METLLLEFIDTLHLSLTKRIEQSGALAGFDRLTINQFQYLDAIYQLGAPPITEVARKLQVSRASATAGISRLVNLGYVTRSQSQADKRSFLVSLTAAGEQLIQAKYRALKAYEDFIHSALTEAEARQFAEILSKLVAVFRAA